MHTRANWIIVALVLGAVPSLAAHSPRYTIRLDDQVDQSNFPFVTVRFTILGPDGKPAKDLPPAVLRVEEEGNEVYRELKRLQSEPMTVVLVIDTSGSMALPADRDEALRQGGERPRPRAGPNPPWRTKLDEAKRAAERFFDRLDPRSPCGLVLFHSRPWKTEAIGADRGPLRRSVQAASPTQGTAIYDALDKAIDELSDLGDNVDKSRRAVVLMTDGKDESTSNPRALRAKADRVIKRAKEHKVQVYTIGLGEVEETVLNDGGPRRVIPADLDEESLKRLAEETGGRYHHVRDAEKLAGVFEHVAGQLGSSYSVTFRSTRPSHDGTSRGIVVRYGDLAAADFHMAVHGLLTPESDHVLYLALLGMLGLLLSAPALGRRLYQSYANGSAGPHL